MTGQQRACLFALRHGRFVNPGYLASCLGTSPQGAVQTAASLVRQGLLERSTRHGWVEYRLTLKGRDIAAIQAQRSEPGR